VASAFEGERRDATRRKVEDHRADQLLLEAEHERNRKGQGESSVRKRVVQYGEGRSAARGGVQIEQVDSPVGLLEGALQERIELDELLIFSRLDAAAADPLQNTVAPHAIEIAIQETSTRRQRTEISRKRDDATVERLGERLERREDPLERRDARRFVAVESGHADETRTGSAIDASPEHPLGRNGRR